MVALAPLQRLQRRRATRRRRPQRSLSSSAAGTGSRAAGALGTGRAALTGRGLRPRKGRVGALAILLAVSVAWWPHPRVLISPRAKQHLIGLDECCFTCLQVGLAAWICWPTAVAHSLTRVSFAGLPSCALQHCQRNNTGRPHTERKESPMKTFLAWHWTTCVQQGGVIPHMTERFELPHRAVCR
jgi:hypothetical protein